MKFGVGTLFVILGLVLLWLAVTGRLANVENAWGALSGKAAAKVEPAANTSPRDESLRVLSEALNVESGSDFSVLPALGFSNPSYAGHA